MPQPSEAWAIPQQLEFESRQDDNCFILPQTTGQNSSPYELYWYGCANIKCHIYQNICLYTRLQNPVDDIVKHEYLQSYGP